MKMEVVNSIVVDFGTVYCDTKPTRIVKIKNNSSIDQIYKVEKYNGKPRLDSGFKVKPVTSPSVKSSEEFTFTVEFTPNTVNTRCCDSFIIKHLFGAQTILVTKATVKGPECSLSCCQLKLMCPGDKKKFAKQFDLTNNGHCLANFQFIIAHNHPLIRIEPCQGCISPLQKIHITVTYTPVDCRPYFKRIFCLISNHEPIFFDICAVWLKCNENIKWNVGKDCVPYDGNGYLYFLHDVTSFLSKDEYPLIPTEKTYIDFGHCRPKSSKEVTFSLMNNCSQKLFVVWNKGIFTKEFKIHPRESELEANGSVTFTAIFKPSVRDMLFGTVLEAQVFTHECLLSFPLDINLKGDSFEELSCGWAAQYLVEPCSLVLPPCMPSPFTPSHTTLTIHRKGHLPLAFQFHPPQQTNFCVKPQQGLIHDSFQIVVVQYQPTTFNDAIDTEKWLLTFNTNENLNQCTVEFGCSIETPNVVVNNGQDIEFPAVHPGSEGQLFVDLFNSTRFSFWYSVEVLRGEDVLSAEGLGELWPHEHTRIPLQFLPVGPGSLESQLVWTPSLEPGVVGRPTTANVKALCCITNLTVVPAKLFLIKVIRDFPHERVFEVTNSGDALIKGSFTWTSDENCSREDLEVTFSSEHFYLEPGMSVTVEVTITPYTTGTKNIVINYFTSISSAVSLLPVTIECVYPILQVTDLRMTNSGPLFTKLHYWKMMQIDKLNMALHDINPGKTLELQMNLPSFVCDTKSMTIELLVENESELGMQLSIQHVVSCECKPVKVPVSFSVSKWDRNCPHRNQVEVTPMSAHIQPESYVILKMTTSYNTVGEVDTQFLLTFTPDDYEELKSNLKLHITRTSIPNNTVFLDAIEPKENGDFVFNMRPVYICDVNPIAQGFLLYNNTRMVVNFEVDDEKLRGTPFKYIGEKNQISSLSNHSLLFTFLPYCCMTYSAEVEITVNDKPQKIVLRGTGVSALSEVNGCEIRVPRRDKLNQISPPGFCFSTSHIDIGPIMPKSTLRNVFFINNNSKDVICFKFSSTKLHEVAQIRVQPVKGIIQPGEVIECRLSCCCRSWPSYITFTLACAYANFSQYVSTVQALHKYYEDLLKHNNHFIITESGTENVAQKVMPPTENWPEKMNLTMSVTVDVKDPSAILKDDDVLPVCPLVVEPKYDTLEIDDEKKVLIIDVLERLLWQVLNETYQNIQEKIKHSELRYEQIKILDSQTDVEVPCHMTQTVIEDILYSTWQELFSLSGRYSCEHLRRNLIQQLQAETRIFRNSSQQDNIRRIPTVVSISESFMSIWSGRLSSKIS